MSASPGPTTRKNLAFYGGASLMVLLLIYLGWIYPKRFENATGSLLSSAIAEFNLAGMIPVVDKDGNSLEDTRNLRHRKAWVERERLLDEGWQTLDRVEKQDPGLAITRELRAYSFWLRKDYRQARTWYQKSLKARNTGADLKNRVRLNLARLDLVEKKYKDASVSLDAVAESDRSSEWYVLKARIQESRGDHQARSRSLAQGYQRAGKEEKSLRLVANAAIQMADGIAASCLEGIANKSASEFYELAKLKMKASKPDSSRNALREAGKLDPGLCARLIRRDAKIWKGDPVAQELQKVAKEATEQRPSGPGR